MVTRTSEVSIPENGAIPFEGVVFVISDLQHDEFQSPRNGEYFKKISIHSRFLRLNVLDFNPQDRGNI